MLRGPSMKPSLENALDLALLDPERTVEVQDGGWAGSSSAASFRVVALRGDSKRKAYVLHDVPGMFSSVASVHTS
jgi:hypothetical protein